ncbi:MAG: hypothetical protein IT220_08840 [Flavobacteriaceae bacterium]|nr:hypothetical protein [Flavobacteriaceae bacterium]
MKYRLLTKEQFESLHQEFASFLAVLEIDKAEWDMIKVHQVEKVDDLLAQFSDLVWEDVLNRARYLEHHSPDSINLFCCEKEFMDRLVVRLENPEIDLLTQAGFDWFINHSNDASIQYFKGKKSYQSHRNAEIFKLIEEGSILTDGQLYEAVSKIIN